jgi:hypothetical protein
MSSTYTPLRTILVLAAATALSAQTVYLTPKGKTYHEVKTCMALSHSDKILTATKQEAEKHGLKACAIEARRSRTKKAGNNESWAK